MTHAVRKTFAAMHGMRGRGQNVLERSIDDVGSPPSVEARSTAGSEASNIGEVSSFRALLQVVRRQFMFFLLFADCGGFSDQVDYVPPLPPLY